MQSVAVPDETAMLAATLLETESVNDPDVAATAVASVFARVQELAEENEALRASLSEERTMRLGLLESNRELEWRVRTGASAGADASGARREWEDSEARLQLLLTENNLLEARERQTAEELRREQAISAKLLVSHAEAISAAKQAADAAHAADEAAREESEVAREAPEAAREAHVLATSSEAALANLRNELTAVRAELHQALAENAVARQQLERLQTASLVAESKALEHAANARASVTELRSQLVAQQQQQRQLEQLLAQARGEADGHAAAAERMRASADAARDEARVATQVAEEARRAAALGARREAELEERVGALSRRLEAHADELQRHSVASQKQVAKRVQAHSRTLSEAHEAAQKEATLAAERELALHGVADELRAALERRGREVTMLQAQLDAAVSAHAQAKAQVGEAAAGGNRALVEEAMSAKARAETAHLLQQQQLTELRAARDELTRLKAALETKSAEVERAEIRGRRAVAQAEVERDTMGARLQQKSEAVDAAHAENFEAIARGRAEVDEVRRIADLAAQAHRAEKEKLLAQVADSTSAAAGLQELLEAQRKVAEGYRLEAARSLARLSQLETTQPHFEHTLASYRELQQSEREKLSREFAQQQTQLQRALSSSLAASRSESLSEVRIGLDELTHELRAARAREEEQMQRVQAARLVVLG